MSKKLDFTLKANWKSAKKEFKEWWRLLKPSAGTTIVFGGYILSGILSVLYAFSFGKINPVSMFEFTVMISLAAIINTLVDVKKHLFKTGGK